MNNDYNNSYFGDDPFGDNSVRVSEIAKRREQHKKALRVTFKFLLVAVVITLFSYFWGQKRELEFEANRSQYSYDKPQYSDNGYYFNTLDNMILYHYSFDYDGEVYSSWYIYDNEDPENTNGWREVKLDYYNNFNSKEDSLEFISKEFSEELIEYEVYEPI